MAENGRDGVIPDWGGTPSKVEGILGKLATGKLAATCNRLEAFAAEVSAQRGKSLTEEQADGF